MTGALVGKFWVIYKRQYLILADIHDRLASHCASLDINDLVRLMLRLQCITSHSP